MIDKTALKEAFVDTAVATPLNLVLNYVLLALLISWDWGAEEITIVLTAVFFVVAIVRKYYVRQFFKRNENE